ncbi:MAG: CAP domain-containing protein [Synechococcales cyanobacterium CRU_2_2]|nr:CAP domain-containing protein [Synechococcales cyanobacterium CRU_2_2]
MINPKELPAAWIKGLTAAVLIGAGTLYFGHDSLYFHNGFGGEQWKMGAAQVNALDAHQARSPQQLHAKALALVNRDREANGLPSLILDPALAQVAQQQAKDMAQRSYFSSRSPEGSDIGDRLRAAGISAPSQGENLLFGEGWGQQLAYRQVELLERQGMYNRVHRENLLSPAHTHVGFGFVADLKTRDIYAVQVFRGEASATVSPATVSPATASPATASAATTSSTTAIQDPFRAAVNAATVAAQLTQTARSPQQWAAVAEHWHRAIANMQAVPPEHPRRAVAQQKAQEYASNLAYAQQNAGGRLGGKAIAPTSKSTGTALATASQIVAPKANQPKFQISQSEGLKLLLMLLGGTALALILSVGPLGLFKSEDQAMPTPPKKLKQPLPWGLIISNAVHDLWGMQPFFKTERVYKMTAATSAHKLQRKPYRRLLNLAGDQATAMQLIKENLRRHPRQSADWCCEQAIKDLEKQRQRENKMQQEG